MGGNDKGAIKKNKKKTWFCPQAWGETNQRGRRRGSGGGAEVTGSFEGCCGSWQQQLERHQGKKKKTAAFHDIHPLRSAEVGGRYCQGVNPSHHCQWAHIRATASLLTPPSPLPLFTALWFVFDCGVYRLVLSPASPPPHPYLNCTPGGVYGEADRMFGPPGDQSLLSECMCRCSPWPFQLQ